jgi:hypothetical protein
MGESLGVGGEHGHQRARELGNVCLWCDELFARHFDVETLAARVGPAGDEGKRPLLPVLGGRRR